MAKIRDVIPHKLTLERRNQSKFIYARFKHPKLGVWREKSTGVVDEEAAGEIARRFFYDLELKIENNIPTTQYKMGRLIDDYLNALKGEHSRHAISDSNFQSKVRVTNKFIRPFFERRMLHTIDAKTLQEFAAWRRDYWVNQPVDAIVEYERNLGCVSRNVSERERRSVAHMRDERAILNALFRLATQKRWIKEWQVPDIDFKSAVVGKSRPTSKVKPNSYFTSDEYQRIKIEMLTWALRPAKFQYRRVAAYYYVMLAFNCGVRPGTGIDSLRWCDLKLVQAEGKSDEGKVKEDGLIFLPSNGIDELRDVRIDIFVPTSKIGSHKSIGLGDAFRSNQDYRFAWLEMAETFRNKQRKQTKGERRDIPTKWDEQDPLFLLPNDYQLKSEQASAYFTKFLDEADMRFAEGTQDARSLYSTRHSFITHLQTIGVPDGMICEFSGTSPEMLRKHYSHPDPAKVGHMFGDYER